MGIIDRAQSVVASNFNALLSRLEEPGRDLAQLLTEMKEQILRAQRELITTVGEAKREEARTAALKEEVERWENRAALAVKMGDDQLAREALSQKRRLLDEQQRGQSLRSERLSTAAAMKAQIERMKELHRSYAQRQHLTATQVAHARAGGKVENLGQVGSQNPFENFERFENAIEGAEAEVEAQAEVNALLDRTALGTTTRSDLDARFRELEAQAQEGPAPVAVGSPSAPAAAEAGAATTAEPAPPVRVRIEP